MIRNRCAALLALLFLSACGGMGGQGGETKLNVDIDGAALPPGGIQHVGAVAVSEEGGDRLRLVVVADRRYRVGDVMAVLWCRARAEAKARNYDGWYALSLRQAYSGAGTQRQAAIGVIQMFRGRPPQGRQTLAQMENWCLKAPSAARPGA
jgi:hypothetical protein